MKNNFVSLLIVLTILSCNKSENRQINDNKNLKWDVYEITIENFDTHNLISYYQNVASNGSKGYAELSDDSKGETKLVVFDGKGDPIIKSTFQKSDVFSGGYEAVTNFYNKPNEKKTNQLLQTLGTPFQTKERTIRDFFVETHSIVRFIPVFFSSEDININGIQFDLPAKRESIYVKLIKYNGNQN